jgi:hypothetical protein
MSGKICVWLKALEERPPGVIGWMEIAGNGLYFFGVLSLVKWLGDVMRHIFGLLKNIQEDPSLLGWASAKAQKAFDLITKDAEEKQQSAEIEAIAA